MKYIKFDCGCQFPLEERDGKQYISFKPTLETTPLTCKKTWDLLSSGKTCGCFQLESHTGKHFAKLLKPDNIEHLAALIAIIRPGCISGDTSIMMQYYDRTDKGFRYTYRKKTLRELYQKQPKTLISYNEETGKLIHNNVQQIIYNGNKDVYKLCFRKKSSYYKTHDYISNLKVSYNLECTLDHMILTTEGYKKLEDMQPGDRFAVIKYTTSSRAKGKRHPGERYFKNICFAHYKSKCVFCDWKEGTLDVNHIYGNRKTNNNPENLNFFCPNHHRLYSEGIITPEEVIQARSKYELPQKEDIEWAEYIDKKYVGTKDVYDIVMDGPWHNFIAGCTIVHNCLNNIIDGKNTTMHYIDRKNGSEPIEYYHSALEPILNKTMGILAYQEEALQIAKDIAGFSLEEADSLRKSIGKKDVKLMSELKDKFITGAINKGVVNEEQAKEIFGWIEASNRYSFNKCLTKDSLIETSKSIKPLSEAVIGDKILSPCETKDNYVTIINIYNNGIQPVYKITLENGQTIKCTLLHQFLCEDRQKHTLLEILAKKLKILTKEGV